MPSPFVYRSLQSIRPGFSIGTLPWLRCQQSLFFSFPASIYLSLLSRSFSDHHLRCGGWLNLEFSKREKHSGWAIKTIYKNFLRRCRLLAHFLTTLVSPNCVCYQYLTTGMCNPAHCPPHPLSYEVASFRIFDYCYNLHV